MLVLPIMGTKPKEICEVEKVILEAIKESGMNQVELAAKSGVSQGLLSLFLESDLSKRRTITLPVADRLCKVLGLKLMQTEKAKKGKVKMPKKFPFRKRCDLSRVRKLCRIAIKIHRGKMISEQILKELDSQELTEETRNKLSKWVYPKRDELVQPIFEYISIELFGFPTDRND